MRKALIGLFFLLGIVTVNGITLWHAATLTASGQRAQVSQEELPGCQHTRLHKEEQGRGPILKVDVTEAREEEDVHEHAGPRKPLADPYQTASLFLARALDWFYTGINKISHPDHYFTATSSPRYLTLLVIRI